MKRMNYNSTGRVWAIALGQLLSALALAAAPPHLTPLLQGQWPGHLRGPAYDVKMLANRAYVAAGSGGLVIFIFTTNPVTLPFEFIDFDVRLTNYPQKFYRVRQP